MPVARPNDDGRVRARAGSRLGLADLGEVLGRVDVDEAAHRGDRGQERLERDLDDGHLGEHGDEPATSRREHAARDGQAVAVVEREQRLDAFLGDRHDDARAVARVPQRADDGGLQVRDVRGDREHPVVGSLAQGGDEPAERALVGGLVDEYRRVRRADPPLRSARHGW